MNKLSKIDLLWLRACKYPCDTRLKRMKSIYRRFYLATGDDEDTRMGYMLKILSNVLDRAGIKFTVYEMIEDNHPSNWWKYGAAPFESYSSRMVKLLSSKVQLMRVSEISGWVMPAWVRNSNRCKDAEA